VEAAQLYLIFSRAVDPTSIGAFFDALFDNVLGRVPALLPLDSRRLGLAVHVLPTVSVDASMLRWH
jgi:hypothetical protein